VFTLEHLTSIVIITVVVYYFCSDYRILNDIRKAIINIFKKKPNSVLENAINAVIKTIPKNDEYMNEEDLIQFIRKTHGCASYLWW
jgi:hypothetical protein